MGGSHPLLFWFTVVASLGLTESSLAIQTRYLGEPFPFACSFCIYDGVGYWSAQYDDHDADEVSSLQYLLVYSMLLTGASILYALATSVFTFGSLRASRDIHHKLISSVLGTTLRWLDSTPTARVIARCTQDMQAGSLHQSGPRGVCTNSALSGWSHRPKSVCPAGDQFVDVGQVRGRHYPFSHLYPPRYRRLPHRWMGWPNVY
jgi:hypothetical protein